MLPVKADMAVLRDYVGFLQIQSQIIIMVDVLLEYINTLSIILALCLTQHYAS